MVQCGGIVVESGERYWFIPASVASTVVPAALVVPVPGLVAPAVGLVLTEDRVATVLQIGRLESEHMIMCGVDGGSVALSGARVVATGVFPASEDSQGVFWRGHLAHALDVRAWTRYAEAAIWRAQGPGNDERHG